ncbi:hypothetical protein PG984_000407 [Apiospora sp. TS-2023a]
MTPLGAQQTKKALEAWPVKSSEILRPVEGAIHLKRLRPVFQQRRQKRAPQPRRGNVLILGCKAVARVVWRCSRGGGARFGSSSRPEVMIPTVVIGVGFDSVPPGSKYSAYLGNHQSLTEIFEAVRDALTEKGITEYGLEVTLLGLLPTSFAEADDGLLDHIACVISNERGS